MFVGSPEERCRIKKNKNGKIAVVIYYERRAGPNKPHACFREMLGLVGGRLFVRQTERVKKIMPFTFDPINR